MPSAILSYKPDCDPLTGFSYAGAAGGQPPLPIAPIDCLRFAGAARGTGATRRGRKGTRTEATLRV